MARNRYTRLVHQQDSDRVAGQEQELIRIGRNLRRPGVELFAEASSNGIKERRRHRLERKWDKARSVRPGGGGES